MYELRTIHLLDLVHKTSEIMSVNIYLRAQHLRDLRSKVIELKEKNAQWLGQVL